MAAAPPERTRHLGGREEGDRRAARRLSPAGPGPDARRSGSRKPDRPVLGPACSLVGAQLGETEARALAAIGRCASSPRGTWLPQASWARRALERQRVAKRSLPATAAAAPTSAAASAEPVRRRPEASPKLIASCRSTPTSSSTPAVALTFATAPPDAIGISPAAAETQSTIRASVGEKPIPSAASSSVLPAARVDQQPSRNHHATSSSPRRRLREPRHAHEVLAGDEDRAGADPEEDDEQKRIPEARRARRRRRDRERQEGDGVDEAERDDRQRDRLEAELDTRHPPERPDLDQVVEPERQDDAARGGRAAGGQAAGAVRPAAGGEELLPAERAQHEAREVEDRGAGDEADVRPVERPARVRE